MVIRRPMLSLRTLSALVFVLLVGIPTTTSAQVEEVFEWTEGVRAFELYDPGMIWWSAYGVCGGEFPETGRVGLLGTLTSEGQEIAENCNVLPFGSNAVRVGSYVYYFADGALRRRSPNIVGRVGSDLVPEAPDLSGHDSVVLTAYDDGLLIAAWDMGPNLLTAWSMPLEPGSTPTQRGQVSTTSESIRAIHFSGETDANAALFVLTGNGTLYRFGLEGRAGPPTVVETGVSDIALHKIINIGSSTTSLYIAKGTNTVSPGGGDGQLIRYRIAANEKTVVLNGANLGGDQSQILSVGTDSSGFFTFGSTKQIYVVKGNVSCGELFCTAGTFELWRHTLPGADDTGWERIVTRDEMWNLRSDDDYVYWVGNNKIERIRTDAPPLELDVQADFLEIIQTVQNLANDVPLIQDKLTFVRAYAHVAEDNSGGTGWIFTGARLRGSRQGVDISSPIYPINMPDYEIPTNGDMSFNRDQTSTNLLFQLPYSWTEEEDLTLDFELMSPPGETGSLPNGITLDLTFVSTSDICYFFIPIDVDGLVYDPFAPNSGFPDILARMLSMYPIPSVRVIHHSTPIHVDNLGTETFKAAKTGLFDVIKTLTPPSGCVNTHYVGMAPWSVNDHLGLTTQEKKDHGFPLGVAWGGTTVQMTKMSDHCGETTPSWSCPQIGLAITHESGHNYGLGHVPCGVTDSNCFVGSDVETIDGVSAKKYFRDNCSPPPGYHDYPYDACRIGPAGDPTTYYGFDSVTHQVITPDHRDIMSYGTVQWASDITFRTIYDAISGPDEYVPPAQQKYILFSGTANTSEGTGEIIGTPVLTEGIPPDAHVAADLALAAPGGSGFFVALLDENGQELSSTPVGLTPTNWDDGTADGGGSPNVPLSQYIPFPAGAHSVTLLYGDAVIDQLEASEHPPVVSIDALTLNPSLGAVALSWTATDEDGDSLTYSVQLSLDGMSWLSLPTDPVTPFARFDNLPGGELTFRVIASDSFHTAVAVSDTITLPEVPPRLIITGLAPDARVPFGELITLGAFIVDQFDTAIDPALLSWQLTGPEDIEATGDELHLGALPPGPYEIALTLLDTEVTLSFEVLPVVIPTLAPPNLDGHCNETIYDDAASIYLGQHTTGPITARIVHGNDGFLYACIEVLEANSAATLYDIGIAVDLDSSMDATPQTADMAFFVDQEGFPTQLRGDGSTLVPEAPDPYFAGRIAVHGDDLWSAELSIPDRLVGGWDHLAAIALVHRLDPSATDLPGWPPEADLDAPSSWAPAWFGDGPPPMDNRAPKAYAGLDRYLLPTSAGRVALDGSGSQDPDGDSLDYAWTQTVGDAVVLNDGTTSIPTFAIAPVQAKTTYTFQLVVNDGTLPSDPDTVDIVLLPTNKQSECEAPETYYADADEDTFGNDEQTVSACALPDGYVERGGDCNDDAPEINPDAEEILDDGVDNNCDGFTDSRDPNETGSDGSVPDGSVADAGDEGSGSGGGCDCTSLGHTTSHSKTPLWMFILMLCLGIIPFRRS